MHPPPQPCRQARSCANLPVMGGRQAPGSPRSVPQEAAISRCKLRSIKICSMKARHFCAPAWSLGALCTASSGGRSCWWAVEVGRAAGGRCRWVVLVGGDAREWRWLVGGGTFGRRPRQVVKVIMSGGDAGEKRWRRVEVLVDDGCGCVEYNLQPKPHSLRPTAHRPNHQPIILQGAGHIHSTFRSAGLFQGRPDLDSVSLCSCP